MRVVLVCLMGKKKTAENEYDALRATRLDDLNEAQAMAIAIGMRDDGRLAPLLVIEKGSALEQQALENGIPYLLSGPFLRFQLWRWQRKHSKLVIQTIGPDSMGVGYKLLRMRKKDSAILAHAFFMKAPEGKLAKSKAMLRAKYALCGSNHVAAKIAELPPAPIIDAPGLPTAKWIPAAPYQAGSAAHFVFGMAQSLEPMSGALLVIRAMAALWQRSDLPPWEVRMFGGGPRFREVLNEAESLGVASRLCLLDNQHLPQMLPLCHAWLAPGTNPREFPETAWAGIAAGVPVICVKSPLHDERLMSAPDAPAPALRVASNDPQSLARAMIGLMRDERLRERLTSGGEAIRPEIGLAAMAARTRRIFEKWANELEAEKLPGASQSAKIEAPETPEAQKNQEIFETTEVAENQKTAETTVAPEKMEAIPTPEVPGKSENSPNAGSTGKSGNDRGNGKSAKAEKIGPPPKRSK